MLHILNIVCRYRLELVTVLVFIVVFSTVVEEFCFILLIVNGNLVVLVSLAEEGVERPNTCVIVLLLPCGACLSRLLLLFLIWTQFRLLSRCSSLLCLIQRDHWWQNCTVVGLLGSGALCRAAILGLHHHLLWVWHDIATRLSHHYRLMHHWPCSV